jgi:hypothetical protein
VINIDDLNKLKNEVLALSEAFILDGIPLDSEWIDLIQHYCPNLKYLFIRHNCNCAYPCLDLKKLLCVEMFMKINTSEMDSQLSINPPSTMENFAAHILRINPKNFEIIEGKVIKINLYIDNLKKLKSL